MSVIYQDFQCLQEDTKPAKCPGATNHIHQAITMSRRIPAPSSALICSLSAACTGLIFIIIILIVTITRQGVDETERSLEVRLRNLSIEVHSKVDHLYENSYRIMEKLNVFESFMEDFKKNDVSNKVTHVGTLVKFFLSDEIAGSLNSDNQRILGAVRNLADGIRNKNGTNDPLCESGWTHHGLNCYYLSRNPRPWDYAKKQCEDKKAHLVVINGQEEMNFLHDLSLSMKVWIGLSAEKGIWKWVDGTSYEKTPKFWKSGHPWNLIRISGQSQITMCGRMDDGDGWSSYLCSSSYLYVCEKKRM